MSTQLVPANHYTVEQLAEIYNRTRVDYLVPMPMSADRLAEYIQDFDIDLNKSVVALLDEEIAGLGMLGLRKKRAWITRLGVLPQNRRVGIGEMIFEKMLENARVEGIAQVYLEVIKGNERARALFKKHGFLDNGECLVFRRAPGRPESLPSGDITLMEKEQALDCLRSARSQTWINQPESMSNAAEVFGMSLMLQDGSYGWIIFRKKIPTLSHVIMHTWQGDPVVVGKELLNRLHILYPRLDTYAENIYSDDPHIPAYLSLGYFEAFRRTEMIAEL